MQLNFLDSSAIPSSVRFVYSDHERVGYAGGVTEEIDFAVQPQYFGRGDHFRGVVGRRGMDKQGHSRVELQYLE